EEHRRRIAPPAREPSPIESTPDEPDTRTSRPDTPPFLATEDVLPSLEVMVQDTPMALGDGKNTDATGLGDSKHAPSSVPPGFELASSPPCFPPTSPSGSIDGLSEGVPGTQPTPETPMEVPLPDTQPEDTDASLARMDEAMAAHNAFLAERGFSSSSAPRHSSTTGSILDSLEDIRSGNTVPVASPTGSVESDTPTGILRVMDQARGLEGIESIMAISGRFHTLERAVRALTVLVGQQGDEIIALQDKLSSRRRRFPPSFSSSTPTPTSTQTSFTGGSGGNESIEEVTRVAPTTTKPSFSEVVQRL